MSEREDVRAWFPVDRPPSPRRARKQALADELRALVADVLYLDVEHLDEDALVDAEQRLADTRKAVAQLPDIRDKGGVYGNAGDASLFERSPFSGRCNALASPLHVWFEGDRTFARATYGLAYEGPPGSVHGGHVIGAFDDVLGVAQAASGTAGFTGTLSVRLVARTPLHEQIDYEAGVHEVSGRKVTVRGRSTCDGVLLAEATGIFVAPRDGVVMPPRD